MHTTKPSLILFAMTLSMLAGYVDAMGFISMGGFFVSFMSGNSTRLGVALGTLNVRDAAILIGIIAAFVTGVMAGTIIGHFNRNNRTASILLFVAALLLAGAGLHDISKDGMGMAVLAVAMGAINTIFERDGEVSIAITYMTGTLVRMGQRIAGALLGGPKFLWLRYFALWAGLITGSCMGTAIYGMIGLNGLWGAAAIAACSTVLAFRLDRGKPQQDKES